MKFISTITLILLMAFQLTLESQPREPQNIYRVIVNSRYVLENGQRTSTFFAINQQISDSLGRLHTEIDFNWETRYPDNYRWHYFEGLSKFKTEFYTKEKLTRVEEYEWNSDSLLKELRVFEVSGDSKKLIVRVENSFDSNGNVIRSTGFNDRGRRGYRARYSYDNNGTEINRRVRGKRATPPDSIMMLQRTPAYDDLGRIIKERVIIERHGVEKTDRIYEYSYNDIGRLSERITKDAFGNQLKREEYIYRRDNRLQQKKVYDADDNLIDWLAWRYEIYKTSDRRHRVLD